MFTTPCFIRKNTPELRAKLDNLGYDGVNYNDDGFLCTFCSMYSSCDEEAHTTMSGAFDCGTNEEMFLSLAALRNNSDYMQWFTDNDKWALCYLNKGVEFIVGNSTGLDWNMVHKATKEEIINYFNK